MGKFPNYQKLIFAILTRHIVFTGFAGMMTHNYRLYGTVLLLIEFLIVAMGVVFVQMLAPVIYSIYLTTNRKSDACMRTQFITIKTDPLCKSV